MRLRGGSEPGTSGSTGSGLRRGDPSRRAGRRSSTSDFLRQLKAGQIHVRGAVSHFTRGGVVFADGQEELFDVVVAATGFTSGLERLLDVRGALDDRGYPRGTDSTANPGLFFIGYDESARGQLYEANRQSKRLALRIERYLQERSR